MHLITLAILVAVGIATTISGLIVAVRARRRMKKSLGKSASNLDLVSFRTWNQVEEAEQKSKENQPIHPT